MLTNPASQVHSSVGESSIKVLVLAGPGTNCDAETVFAFGQLGCEVEERTLRLLSGEPEKLREYQILIFPGGFTYGDYAGAGKLFSQDLKHFLADEVQRFLEQGKFILGICNGFQVLAKSGLLPGSKGYFQTPSVTLEVNQSMKFEDRWIRLRPESRSFWIKGLPRLITLPVAHAEGRLVAADKKLIPMLEQKGQVLFRYCNPQGKLSGYPHDPNGSQGHIAALTDPSGQIMGMMPHPERFFLPDQHPAHLRKDFKEKPHGAVLLNNLVREAASRFG